MTVGGLRAGINGSLIERLSAYSGSTSANPLSALSGGASNSSIRSGLRTGARAFSNAVQNINNVISIVNISKDVLTELGGITDKLIDLTERASKANVGQQTRRRLNAEFKKLSNEFQKVVKNADLGQFDITTKEGLAELFSSIGLDKDSSTSIAEVFSRFILSDKDGELASQKVKGTRPVPIPADAFGGGLAPIDEYRLRTISGNVDSGFISSAGNYFSSSDHVLNPGDDLALITQKLNGTYSSMPGQFEGDIALMSVNASTGYGLIRHTAEIEGGGVEVQTLYLVDPEGRVVSHIQMAEGEHISSAGLSDNNEIVFLISEVDGLQTNQTLYHAVLDEFGDEFIRDSIASISYVTSDSSEDRFTGAQISADGTQVVTGRKNLTDPSFSFQLIDVDTKTVDEVLEELKGLEFAFVGNTALVSFRNGASYEVFRYEQGAPEPLTLLYENIQAQNNSGLRAIEDQQGNLYFAFSSSSSSAVELYRFDSTTESSELVTSISLSELGIMDVNQLSLAENSKTGRIDLGISGRSLSTGDTSFHRWEGSSLAESGPTLSSRAVEYENLFDRPNGISNRPDAFRMLNDLKALKKQIDSNIEALDLAVQTLEDNIHLVRAAGLAFLELSNGIKDFSSAAEAAQAVRSLIRGQGRAAASQAVNLEPLAITALFLEDNQSK